MSDRDDKLWAAVLKVLPTRDGMTTIAPTLVVADAILAAVNAVLEEGETVEWGYRHADGNVFGLSGLMTEDLAREVARNNPGITAIRRRITEWEAMPS